tara:strand:- start:236 stop:451 length:216 start_codon:yes stop_codon:yes gene_type:complete
MGEKKNKVKCKSCKKTLKLIEQVVCVCGNYYCPKHMNRHSHKCQYDIKKEIKIKIEKNNPKLGCKMVDKID